MTTNPETNQPVGQPADPNANPEDMPSQAELDAKLPGHVPSAAERAGDGPSPWLEAAQAGPEALSGTPPGDLFFTYEKPNGEQFVGGAAQAEGFLRQGFKVVGEQRISDSNELRRIVSPGSYEEPASGAHLSEATATPGAMPPSEPAPGEAGVPVQDPATQTETPPA